MSIGHRRTLSRRVGAIAAGIVLIGCSWSGVASAQDTTSTTPLVPVVPIPVTTPSFSVVLPTTVPTVTIPPISLPPISLPTIPTLPTSSPTTTTTPGGGGVGTGAGDLDCRDFTSQAQAQAYFESIGGSAANNADDLDANHNGIACEDYPYGTGQVVYSQVASVPTGGVDTGDGSFGTSTP